MAVHEVDPISRIEGHLGVKLSTDDATGLVTGADVHGNLWRGFENFLIGRDPNDAITFTQRICGVCPLPHAIASTHAVEAVLGYNHNGATFKTDIDGYGVPVKALHVRNLVYSAEFLMSHITHFYHLVAPSYIQGPNVPPWTPFFSDNYYHPLLTNASGFGTGNLTGVSGLDGRTTLSKNAADGFSADLWSAVIKQYVKALRIRRLTFEAGALFAGRMPMVSAFVAGGVTNDPASLASRCSRFSSLMAEVGTFIFKEYVPVALALGALYPNYDNLANATITTGVSAAGKTLWELASTANSGVAPASGNTGYGAGWGNFLSWGAFPTTTDGMTISGGFKLNGSGPSIFFGGKADAATFTTGVAAYLTEHITHSNYANYNGEFPSGSAYPGAVSRTQPDRNGGTKYSWLKAPRWDGHPMEVGPFARMVVNGLYPVSGTLAGNGGIGGLYPAYLKAGYESGLDPKMIEADLAVALVRAGLATLSTGPSGSPSGVTLPSGHDAIVAAYGQDQTRITGIIDAWVRNLNGGLSTMDRIRGRALEAAYLATKMIGMFTGTAVSGLTWPAAGGWSGDLSTATGDTYAGTKAIPKTVTSGFGTSEAPRGALAHFVTIENGKISKYQCVVPTTWNGSPKDTIGNNGPIEQAMMGIPFKTQVAGYGASFTDHTSSTVSTEGGVEALRVAQSFDPCIACAVH